MRLHDYFIGGITIALGIIAIWHACLSWERLMHLAKYRVLVDAFGPFAARVIVAILGAALLITGTLVASGFRFPWQ